MKYRFKFADVANAEWFIQDAKKLFKLTNRKNYVINPSYEDSSDPTLVRIIHDHEQLVGALDILANEWACEYIRPNRFFD